MTSEQTSIRKQPQDPGNGYAFPYAASRWKQATFEWFLADANKRSVMRSVTDEHGNLIYSNVLMQPAFSTTHQDSKPAAALATSNTLTPTRFIPPTTTVFE
ncbi:hypothetical protein Tcan_11887 [Toxocara canis]|uniref:Uncharacterized protein n=1 Tax=Toxocara canis TaxID=6265 RepID=A0A0B2VCJ3_TOXCA|nr:hypothetical protein Tcan_11887 [Toxocara canis]